MDVKNLLNKLKSGVLDFIESQKPQTSEELLARQHAELKAQAEQEQKVYILANLLISFPEEMEKIFWEISAKYQTWGENVESSNISDILHKHITFTQRKIKGNPYSSMLAQGQDYWVATSSTISEATITFETINLKETDTLSLIPEINCIHKMQKINIDKPALLVYYLKNKEKVIPHFHFVA